MNKYSRLSLEAVGFGVQYAVLMGFVPPLARNACSFHRATSLWAYVGLPRKPLWPTTWASQVKTLTNDPFGLLMPGTACDTTDSS